MTDCVQRRNPSNTDATLAEIAERLRGRKRQRLDLWMEDARDLAKAREICPHGEWSAFLKEADISERTASNMLRLAPFKSETVSDLGGVRATLDILARRPDLPAIVLELDETRVELDDLKEREAILHEQLPTERRELIDKALANLVTIKGLKVQLNEATAKLVEPTREIKSLNRRKRDLEKMLAA